MSEETASAQASVQDSNEESLGTIERLDRTRIRHYAGQPRRHFDPEKLRELGGSIKAEGQKTPITVRPVADDPDADYELVDGERRLRACKLMNVPLMLAWIKEVEDDEQQFADSVIANFGREPHTSLETARAIVRIMAGKRYEGMNRTTQIEHAAKIFAHSPAWIYLHLKLLNLHPEVQEMLEPSAPEGKSLSFSVAAYLNNVRDQALQLQVARQIAREKLKTNKAKALVRQAMAKVAPVPGQRERHPSDDFKIFQAFLERLGEGAERVLEMKFKSFGQILQKRTLAERELMLEKIDESIRSLEQIREELKRACKG